MLGGEPVAERHRILCEKEQDRDALVLILARNDYTVRHVKERKNGGSRYTHYIEYWTENTEPIRRPS